MKKAMILVLFIMSFGVARSQFYLGVGPEYIVPMGKFADMNKSAVGFNLQYESRNYCKLWYGFRFDYMSLDSADDNKTGIYVENALLLSPTLRYNILGDDCYKYNYVFYVQGMLHISSIGSTDELNRMGLGGGLGVGAAYSFSFLKRCWMIDLEGLYSAPNVIYRVDGRESLQSLNISLTLSVRL